MTITITTAAPMDITTALLHLTTLQYHIHIEEVEAREYQVSMQYGLEIALAIVTIKCYEQTEKPKNELQAKAWIENYTDRATEHSIVRSSRGDGHQHL